MPITRHSGPDHAAFAYVHNGQIRVWVTVQSTDDCRVRKAMRLWVVVQNVGVERVRVDAVQVVDVDGVMADDRVQVGLEERVLGLDDVALVAVSVCVDEVFEVDALERLFEVVVQVDGKECHAEFKEALIWKAYCLLPGGWWARVLGSR